MPEITVTQIAIVIGALIIGVILGWATRASRAASEKEVINEGWQEQLAAQRNEHERLLDQNKSLMEQNSQYQASNKDAKMRASELSDALKEAFERRDELQRQLKDIRGNLEVAVSERDQLRESSAADDFAAQIAERDARIEKLDVELKNWQDRLPPLIERYQQRNAEAEELEARLAEAQERIIALEEMVGSEQTRVEPVDPDALADGLDASNDPMETHIDTDIETQVETIIEQVGKFEEADDDGEELLDADVLVEDSDDEGEQREPEEEAGEVVAEAFEDGEVEAEAFEDGEVEAEEFEGGEVEAEVPDDDDTGLNDMPRDDLQLIKGVGPAIERTLNEMGIRRFDQIAQMSEYDIDRVAHRLKGFRSRIYREDWIGQARELHDQKVSSQ